MRKIVNIITKMGVLFLTALLAVYLVGCRQIIDTVNLIRYSGEYDKQAVEYCKSVYKAFCESDSSAIEKLISPSVADKHDVRLESEKAFAFISGRLDASREINETDDIDSWSPFHNINSYDYSENYTAGCSIKDITTDTGEKYTIEMRICFAYKPDERNIGIMDISVVDKSDKESEYYVSTERRVKIGEFIETLTSRQMPDKYTDMPNADAFSADIREAYTGNILCALGKGDSEWLLNQFCEDLRNENLKAEVAEVFSFIGGNTTGYSSSCDGGGTKSVDYGTIKEMTDEMTVYDLIGADGNKYEVNYLVTYFDDEQPANIGISNFVISRVGGYNDYREHIILDTIELGGNE